MLQVLPPTLALHATLQCMLAHLLHLLLLHASHTYIASHATKAARSALLLMYQLHNLVDRLMHCAADAEIWTTGSNDSCQLGHKGHDTQLHPSRVEALDAHGVCQVACGQQHMLAVADGGALCAWGAADSGQLGKSTTPTH